MIKHTHVYGKSDGDLLDIFLKNNFDSSVLLQVVNGASTVTAEFANSPLLSELSKTKYNYAIMSDHTGVYTDPWTIDPKSLVPLTNNSVYLINNVEHAANIFAFAKMCRSSIEYYKHLYSAPSMSAYDNYAISVASNALKFESGLVDFPNCLPKLSNLVCGQIAYDSSTNAIYDISTISYIYDLKKQHN